LQRSCQTKTDVRSENSPGKMNIQFFDSYPYRPLQPDLQTLARGARRVDAAVAFVTRPGVAFLRQYLKNRPSGKARLVASVRFPANLSGAANLEDNSDTSER